MVNESHQGEAVILQAQCWWQRAKMTILNQISLINQLRPMICRWSSGAAITCLETLLTLRKSRAKHQQRRTMALVPLSCLQRKPKASPRTAITSTSMTPWLECSITKTRQIGELGAPSQAKRTHHKHRVTLTIRQTIAMCKTKYAREWQILSEKHSYEFDLILKSNELIFVII